jgi:tetratricopeptide (TPR) repeat protein
MKKLICFLLLFPVFAALGQQDGGHLRKGNELYKKGKFNEAEIEYRKGLEKKPDSYVGKYNLSNALYKQKKFKESSIIMDSLIQKSKDPNQQAAAYHNLGNSLLQDKAYAESAEAYKKALKLKPDAEDSRYNLSYALKKLQQQQQQKQQKNQQQKNQNKDQDKKEQQKQQQKDQQKKEEKKQNLNQEDAERMLDALNRDEKDLRKKTDKKATKAGQASTGKDW